MDVTASVDQTAVITAAYAVLATAGYYWHDRIWNRIAWVQKRKARS